jgi:hypothetical protein
MFYEPLLQDYQPQFLSAIISDGDNPNVRSRAITESINGILYSLKNKKSIHHAFLVNAKSNH